MCNFLLSITIWGYPIFRQIHIQWYKMNTLIPKNPRVMNGCISDIVSNNYYPLSFHALVCFRLPFASANVGGPQEQRHRQTWTARLHRGTKDDVKWTWDMTSGNVYMRAPLVPQELFVQTSILRKLDLDGHGWTWCTCVTKYTYTEKKLVSNHL